MDKRDLGRVDQRTFRWFGHVERMVGRNVDEDIRRGRSRIRRKDRVGELAKGVEGQKGFSFGQCTRFVRMREDCV